MQRSAKPPSYFVSARLFEQVALPAHDSATPPDALSSIRLNKEWRNIIIAALEYFYRSGDSDLFYDNDDLLSSVIEDLYSFEDAPMALKTTTIQDNLGANRSTTSTSFVSVTSSQILFTPTYTKMRVNVLVNGRNTNAASSVFIRAMADGVVGNEANEARIENTGNMPHKVSDIWDVVPGVEIELELQFRVNSGTGTLDAGALLVWEIIEYD